MQLVTWTPSILWMILRCWSSTRRKTCLAIQINSDVKSVDIARLLATGLEKVARKPPTELALLLSTPWLLDDWRDHRRWNWMANVVCASFWFSLRLYAELRSISCLWARMEFSIQGTNDMFVTPTRSRLSLLPWPPFITMKESSMFLTLIMSCPTPNGAIF